MARLGSAGRDRFGKAVLFGVVGYGEAGVERTGSVRYVVVVLGAAGLSSVEQG